jgi:AcrR family transcriptional regulator
LAITTLASGGLALAALGLGAGAAHAIPIGGDQWCPGQPPLRPELMQQLAALPGGLSVCQDWYFRPRRTCSRCSSPVRLLHGRRRRTAPRGPRSSAARRNAAASDQIVRPCRNGDWRRCESATFPTVGNQPDDWPSDVALTLLAEQGFDNTSMAQIAQATDIPVEDVTRVVGTKHTIVLTIAGAMLTDVVKILADVDPKTPVVEALWAAHSSVLVDIIAGTGPVTLVQMKHMSMAIASSPDLQKKVAAQRIEMLSGVLANQFGSSMADRSVQHGLKVWSAVLAATYMDVLDKHGRFDPGVNAETPESMRDRLNRSFRIITGRPTDAL